MRFIVSVTTTEINRDDDKQKNSPGNEVITELRNRKWPVMRLQPLDKDRRRAIINCFLFNQKPCTSMKAAFEGREKDHSLSDSVRVETPIVIDGSNKELDYARPSEVVWLDSEGRRLHLLPNMVDSIVHAEATSSVRYLRLLLHALEAGHIQGYNLQVMLHHLLQANDVNSLYLAVLEHFEKGHFPPTTEPTVTASVKSPGKYAEGESLDLCKAKEKKARPPTSLRNECSSLVVYKEQSSLNGTQQPEEKKKELTTIQTNEDDDHGDSYYANESGGFEAADEDKKGHTESFQKAQVMDAHENVDIRTPISKAAETVNHHSHHPTDSSEEAVGISEIPLSLRGGSQQASDPVLNNMLKKALALLFSARHGLQESELWDMLCTLADREAAAAEEGVETHVINHLAFRLMQSRGRLMDLLRDMDRDKNGTVDTHEFKQGLEALGIHLTNQQMENVVKCIDTDGNGQLDFDEIIERYGNAVRRSFVVGKRNTVAPSYLAQQNENDMAAAAREGPENGGYIHNRSTLSEKVKKILICIMRGLGVSYYPNNSLLLLGFDAEGFRSIIHEQFVGDGSLWHRRFVRYFSPLSPSVRRCEELPWHLRKCYRWGGLKSTLTDLRTFEIMWKHPQLKRELISYWLELTQGLLWKNENHEMITKLSETAQPSLLTRLISKRGSRYIFNDSRTTSVSTTPSQNDNTTITCFDIFDGYNKAVELWQAAEKPTMQQLGITVGMIGELMMEMSAQLQDDHTNIPPFLHYPIDTKDLERLGISGVFFQNGGQRLTNNIRHHPIHKLKGDGK